MARTKKAQGGTQIVPISRTPKVSLRTGQLKRLGRLSAKNPDKAERVAGRMVERRSRIARGKEYLDKNVGKLYPGVPEISRKGSKVVKKKMAKGGELGMKSVKAGFDKNPGVTRADIIVAAKGQARGGKKIKKAMDGTTTASMRASRARVASERAEAPMRRKARAAAAAAGPSMMKRGGKATKKMMGGGKCRGGCY